MLYTIVLPLVLVPTSLYSLDVLLPTSSHLHTLLRTTSHLMMSSRGSPHPLATSSDPQMVLILLTKEGP